VAARTLGMVFRKPPINFRVITKDVGGSFGLKTQPWREEIATIAAAILLGRPVKWIEDRLENLISANNAREQEATIRLALDENGIFLASHLEYHINNGAYPHMPEQNVMVPLFTWSCYKMPKFGFTAQGWHTNTVGMAGYRGPWAMGSMLREVLIDDAARELGMDPVELRRRNLVTQADQPTKTCTGIAIEDITVVECLENLLTQVDVEAFRKEQREARNQGRYLGLGIAAYIEPTGGSTIPVLASDVAQIRIEPSGKVNAVLSTHSQGHGTETTMAQVIADRLGVRFEDVDP
jgi:aerobic carbon-monoxide dehydrogenase large subunit